MIAQSLKICLIMVVSIKETRISLQKFGILLSVPLKEITLKGHFGLNLIKKDLESKLHLR